MDNFDNIKKENEELKEKLLLLEKENIELKGCLKKYTSSSRNNETHKKEFINKMKESPIASDKKQKYKNYYYLKNLLLKTDNNSI